MNRPRHPGHARRVLRAAATAVAAAALLPSAAVAAPAADGWSAPIELATGLPASAQVLAGGEDAAGRLFSLAVDDHGGGSVDLLFARRSVDGGPGDAIAQLPITGLVVSPMTTALGPDGNVATVYGTAGAAANTFDFHVASLGGDGRAHDAVLVAGVPGAATVGLPRQSGSSSPLAIAVVAGNALRIAHATAAGWRVDLVPGVGALGHLHVETAAGGAVAFAGLGGGNALWAGVSTGGAWHVDELSADAGANPDVTSLAVRDDGEVLALSQDAGQGAIAHVRAAGGAWTSAPTATSDAWVGAFDAHGAFAYACNGTYLMGQHLAGGAWTDDLGYFHVSCSSPRPPLYDASGDLVISDTDEVRHMASTATPFDAVGQAPLPYLSFTSVAGATFTIGRAGELLTIVGWTRGGQHVDVTAQAYGQTPRPAAAPAVAGQAVAGGALTCTPAAAAGAVTAAAWWTRDGVRVASAAAPRRLTAADVGHRLACLAVYGDAVGTSQESSTPLRVGTAAAPVFTRLPAIAGPAAVGVAVRCAGGAVTGGAATAGSVWLRDGVRVARSRTRAYRVGIRDAGHALQCALEARGAGGATLAASAPRVVRDACTVPALAGLRLRAARALLAASGCRTGAIHRLASGPGRHGAVVRSAPRAGKALRPHAGVALWVRR